MCVSSARLYESRGVGESVRHAVPDVAGYFDDFAAPPGCAKNVMRPDFATDSGHGVAKGAVRLGLPGGGSGPEERVGVKVVRPQGEEAEQAEQRRGGTLDGGIGPLALGFQAARGAGFLKGDFARPAGAEPRKHGARGDVEIGGEKGLGFEFAGGIAPPQPADRRGRLAAAVPEAVPLAISPWRWVRPYPSATVCRCQSGSVQKLSTLGQPRSLAR